MPKKPATVRAINKNIVTLEMDPGKLRVGEIVNVKWGAVRSATQNSLYWCFLEWLIEEGGMKDQGYFFKEELHRAFKGRLLTKTVSTGKWDTVEIKSTTELSTDEFVAYMEKIDALLTEYCDINTAPFWAQYEQAKGETR